MCPQTLIVMSSDDFEQTPKRRVAVGNSSSFILDQADASGDDGEEEEQFDNASQDSRFASDDHLSDD
jgi:hypothetical protein